MQEAGLELHGSSDPGRGVLAFDSVVADGHDDWTRTHVDAVLGDVISPLGWTLVGPAYEHSQAAVWRSFGVLDRRGSATWRFVARQGGRMHLGLTALRACARRMPTADQARIEAELGLGHEPQPATWRDRAWYPRAMAGSAWSMAVLPSRVRRQRRLVARAVEAARREPPTEAQVGALVDRVEALREDLVRVLVPHHIVRMLTEATLGRLRQDCGDDDLAFGLMAALPDLEATQPSLELHRMARAARRTGEVDPTAVDRFVDRFGHRGVSELDPTVPVWAQQRDLLTTLVERMAAGLDGEGADPLDRAAATLASARARATRLPLLRRLRVAAGAPIVRRCCLEGERSKGDVARYVHELRRAVDALRTAVADRLDPGDAPLLAWAELRDLALGTGAVPDDLDHRRGDLAGAAGLPTPPSVDADLVVRGLGSSPGRASGAAIVVHDPLDELVEGEVLVAHATDTAWTPLFLGMRAVVTDVGGAISHSSIVARDLGIPAVVGTGSATAVIRTGDRATVDGDAGEVTVHRATA